MNRVVADSNILISAFLRGGKPLEILELARAGQIELALPEDILNETARVLGTKLRVPAEDVQAFCDEVRGFAVVVTPTERLDAVPGLVDGIGFCDLPQCPRLPSTRPVLRRFSKPDVYRFGDVEVDFVRAEVRREGVVVVGVCRTNGAWRPSIVLPAVLPNAVLLRRRLEMPQHVPTNSTSRVRWAIAAFAIACVAFLVSERPAVQRR